MSHHVVFNEHIPFFSISSTTHSLTIYDLIHIDHFLRILVVYHLRFLVPQILLLMFDQFILIILQVLILYSRTHLKLHFFTVPQDLFEIVDPPLRESIHICTSTKLQDFSYSCYSSSFTLFLASIHYLSELYSYKEAILDHFWQQAMDEELSALHKIDTWDLVPLPPGKSVVGWCWVYKIKINSDRFIVRYKARLVAKRYSL
jgi:hypothetical protein